MMEINVRKVITLLTSFLLFHGNIDKNTHFVMEKNSCKTVKHFQGTFCNHLVVSINLINKNDGVLRFSFNGFKI